MNTIQTRSFERLLRVQGFGVTHQDHFPASSPGGQALFDLGAIVTVLRDQAVSKRTAMREGRQSRRAARAALLEHLDKINAFARVIARDKPGFDDKYRVGRLRSDQSILTVARAFAKEAVLSTSLFQQYGLREASLTELTTLIDTYDRTVREWESARDSQAKARASIEQALDEGAAIVRRLEPIVLDQFASDLGTLAMWERDRRVEPPRVYRRRKPAESEAVVEPPETQVAE